MALTESTIIDQITVTENGTILVREATRVCRDGDQISETYHRSSLLPGQPIEDQDPRVIAICESVWTPEAIEAYQQRQEQQRQQNGLDG